MALTVSIQLSKALRRHLSRGSIVACLPEGSTAEDLLIHMCDQFPLADFARVRLTRGGEGIDGSRLLQEGDEVVLDANDLPSHDADGNPSTVFDLRAAVHEERKYQRLWDTRREEADRSTQNGTSADGARSTPVGEGSAYPIEVGAPAAEGSGMNIATGMRPDATGGACEPSLWRVAVGGRDEVAQSAEVLRNWVASGFVRPDTQVFNPDQGKWMCLRSVSQLADLFPPSETLIQQYRDDYSQAMLVIDREVGGLIQQGKEMQALSVLAKNVATVVELHAALRVYYEVILGNLPVLRRFGSERLRQLGHDPLPTREFLRAAGVKDDRVEGIVLKGLRETGYSRSHWLLEPLLLAEAEYMLDALQILVEPEFVPLSTEPEGETRDRYIPPSVKMAVWRRDEGRCSICGSRERLEYDHIIPVSKGGSNTERNVQLLCEACNRRKSATIE
ncbi:MAG: HNH endonuclease signature motif containing protein [bacterium]